MLEHIILLVYFITLSIGLASLVLMILLYVKLKNDLIKKGILFLLALTADVLFIVVGKYLDINLHRFLVKNIYAFGLGGHFAHFLVMYANVYFTHYILEIPHRKKRDIIFFIITVVSVFLKLILDTTRVEGDQIISAVFPFMDITDIIFFGSLIYIIVIGFLNYKKIKDPDKKDLVKWIIIFLLLSIPTLINDLLNVFILDMQFSTIRYAILSLFLAMFIIRLYFTKFHISRDLLDLPGSQSIVYNFNKEHQISKREEEIIIYLIKGMNNKTIASTLFISPSTVKAHIYNIFKKTGVTNRYELLYKIKLSLKS